MNEIIKKIIEEVRQEFALSPFDTDSMIATYLKEGIYDIERIAGSQIDYDKDMQARVLLKNYVNYRRHGRLAEFKEVYAGEYTEIQIKYFNPILHERKD
ncbi:hypothetical protein G7061_04205 [Erysipelothrix sp. HDW6B]|uniref:hypothetical protein n=1 Tax=Erysipelothrix TaxID=1647 RepID=UPI00135CF576|nr:MULTISPECIES: hypothetical protein [Erysipelothrix]QIK85855.1 hypothetical protein G7061_04205 [Erysipelothrix sp. HDW6B]